MIPKYDRRMPEGAGHASSCIKFPPTHTHAHTRTHTRNFYLPSLVPLLSSPFHGKLDGVLAGLWILLRLPKGNGNESGKSWRGDRILPSAAWVSGQGYRSEPACISLMVHLSIETIPRPPPSLSLSPWSPAQPASQPASQLARPVCRLSLRTNQPASLLRQKQAGWVLASTRDYFFLSFVLLDWRVTAPPRRMHVRSFLLGGRMSQVGSPFLQAAANLPLKQGEREPCDQLWPPQQSCP